MRHTDPEMNAALEEDAAKIAALGGDPGPTFEDLGLAFCGLCGDAMAASETSEEVRAVAGFDICARCMEEELNAPANNARAEVGLVGSGGGRQ